MGSRGRKARLRRKVRPPGHFHPQHLPLPHRLKQRLKLQRHLPKPLHRQVPLRNPKRPLPLRPLRSGPQMPRLLRSKRLQPRCQET
jgi:hypothetical protein